MKYQQLLLLGDSITEYSSRWPAGLAPALADKYVRRLDVVNRGYSGYNSRTIRLALPHILSTVDSKLAAVVLYLGTNDAAIPGVPQHVPLEEFEQNMEYLIDALLQRTPHIVLVTPAIADEKRWPEHSNELTQPYIDTLQRISHRRRLPCVNVRALFHGDASLLDDGLHFTNEGYATFVPRVFDELCALGVDPRLLTMKLPYWRELGADAQDTVDEYVRKSG